MFEKKQIIILNKTREIHFPSVSDLMQIESLKQMFSNGNLDSMKSSFDKQTQMNVVLIEAISTLQTLIPDLKNEIGRVSDLSLKDSLALAKVYKKEFLPWYNSLMSEINSEFEEFMQDEQEKTEE